MADPLGKKPIDSKRVYKIKYKPNGELERYKACLVAKVFTHAEGLDFHEMFAPIAKLMIVRTILAIGIHKKWSIHYLTLMMLFYMVI